MSGQVLTWTPLILALLLGLAGIWAIVAIPANGDAAAPPGSNTRRLQWTLGLFGIVRAAGHAFARPGDASKDQYPLFDLTTLTWFVLVVVAYFLPKIRAITVGSASLSIRDEIEAAKGDIGGAVDSLADLVQSWLGAATIYLVVVRRAADQRRKTEILLTFLQDRMGEARAWLGDTPSANVRIALWTYDPAKDLLEFFWSNEIDDRLTIEATFRPGDGLLGRAFMERRLWNYADASRVQGFRPIGDRPPPYKAIMIVPVYMYETNVVLGMLTIDKPEAVIFTPRAENIGAALASLCALALDAVVERGSPPLPVPTGRVPTVTGDISASKPAEASHPASATATDAARRKAS